MGEDGQVRALVLQTFPSSVALGWVKSLFRASGFFFHQEYGGDNML